MVEVLFCGATSGEPGFFSPFFGRLANLFPFGLSWEGWLVSVGLKAVRRLVNLDLDIGGENQACVYVRQPFD